MRDAEVSDSRPVCDVLRRSILEVCAPIYDDQSVVDQWLSNKTQENISSWIQSERSFSVVCVDGNDRIVGFGLTTLEGEILLLYLVPEALFKGNGKRMLNLMERRLLDEGVDSVHAVSSITAKAFYERNGFVSNGAPRLVGRIEGDFPLKKELRSNASLRLETHPESR